MPENISKHMRTFQQEDDDPGSSVSHNAAIGQSQTRLFAYKKADDTAYAEKARRTYWHRQWSDMPARSGQLN